MVNPQATLAAIADAIHNKQTAASGSFRRGFQEYMEIADLLEQARSVCPHGEFVGWCQNTTGWSINHCNRIMRAAKLCKNAQFEPTRFFNVLTVNGTTNFPPRLHTESDKLDLLFERVKRDNNRLYENVGRLITYYLNTHYASQILPGHWQDIHQTCWSQVLSQFQYFDAGKGHATTFIRTIVEKVVPGMIRGQRAAYDMEHLDGSHDDKLVSHARPIW